MQEAFLCENCYISSNFSFLEKNFSSQLFRRAYRRNGVYNEKWGGKGGEALMKTADRQHGIIEMMMQRPGFVKVQEMRDRFAASDSTIRADLDYLRER
ncbi:MAG: DeoR family transcriptional regulator, partial [Clostridia bacterium]|nr:DeoR family transcriptional regulator [Clostridia bacterium]